MSVQTLVLVGGGHAHALFLGQLHNRTIPGLRVVLVTEMPNSFYSGKAPLHVSGCCSAFSLQINVRRLARQAGVTVVVDRAVGVDLQKKQLHLRYRSPVDFDFISFNIGSVPRIDVPGVREHAIAVKPIVGLLSAWNKFVFDFRRKPESHLRVVLVGGGVSTVELALAMRARLHRLARRVPELASFLPEIHLVCRQPRVNPKGPPGLSRALTHFLENQGVKVHTAEEVVCITESEVVCRSGMLLPFRLVVWGSGGQVEPWLAESGMTCDHEGFVVVDDTLRSVSHPFVFAAGDVATIQGHSLPRAGVFAVRQAPVLFDNVCRLLDKRPLRAFRPKGRYLSLIDTGTHQAFASWGSYWWGPRLLLWKLKHWIDSRFVLKFRQLQISYYRAGGTRHADD